ncbi:MAG TPA: arsenite methyltransferase [Bacteroidales bacterium]|nr:arsenite methyltransferase [Bacteroidales bacterium]HSA44420.1 arsenite methyltransferase [Bacteroidales bacterium]
MSNTNDDLKELVRNKYREIASQTKTENQTSCCGSTACCGDFDYAVFSESYDHLEGYNPDADLGLGCGIPTAFARIREGDTVIDLGSGAGNDCFVARSLVGMSGLVIGIDMTEAMIEKARENACKLSLHNVQFRLGDIENLPVTAGKADVVISNCVLNLVPDKQKAFKEIYRVLKPGGHLSISDVVLNGVLPEKIMQAAEMYAGCVSGAIQKEEYLDLMRESGLTNIKVPNEKQILIPDDVLLNYLNPEELEAFKAGGTGIFSISVYAEKAVSACCQGHGACC